VVAPTGHGGNLLIVAASRDDRRTLFDALDGQGFGTLYTARDAAQARALLTDGPPIELVLLDIVGEAREAVALCALLRGMPAYAHVPVLGILAAEPELRVWGHQRALPGVAEWLRRPIDAGETLARVRAALARQPAAAVPVPVQAADYRFAFDASEDALIVSDPRGKVLEVNPQFERQTGLAAAQVCGRPLHEVLGRDPAGQQQLAATLERDGVVRTPCRGMQPDADGDMLEAITRLAVRNEQLVHVTTVRDRHDLEHAREALMLIVRMNAAGGGDEGMAEAARLLAQGLRLDFVAVYTAFPDDGEGPQLLVQELQPTAAVLPDPLLQPTLKLALGGERLMYARDAAKLAESDDFVRAMGFAAFAAQPLTDERRNVLGALLVGSQDAWDPHLLLPETLRLAAGCFAFELELRRAREQSRVKGLLDGLTGLPNRLLFNDRLETTLAEAGRTGEMFAVLFVDLDRFKSINDSLGHSVGDEVLVAVAKRLRGSVRPSDTVARYAGDEFTLILRHINQRDDVLRIAEKIVRLLELPQRLADGSELHITASIGVSFYPDDAATGERLLKHADVAMYNAKGLGRNNYKAYVAVPEESHQQRMALESKLRQAEKNGELRVHYQPQVDAVSEDIVGMEALVRWEHPELGMISPGFFIPLAEEIGLIVSLGEWVLRTACTDARRWQQKYELPLRVGVNLSGLQLMQPNLPQLVARALHDSGLAAGSLELEVTESISVTSMPHLFENLRALRQMGCHLAIDDFGTGQASLDYLRKLPAERIKVDQSFVRNIGIDPDDEAIVKATLDMAHSLNRKVVAEGVEIEAHLQFLRAHHCDELQGYLFCRPLPASGFDALLAERQRLLQRTAGTGDVA
jgi:diguanylate cyclase (GGDEF)-like protein/PAS domain S-box-containing protein